MRRSDFVIPAAILVIITTVVGFMLYGGEDIIGLDAADTTVLISLLPSVFTILVASYIVSISSGVMLAGAVTGFGLSIAYAVYSLNAVEILIPELVMSASDIEIVVIFAFLILAVILVWRKR